MKRQSAIGLLVCLLVIIIWVAGSQTEAGPIAQEWPQFREKAHGVSFAYPPELRLVIAPAGHLRGLGGWVSQVSLVAVDADAAEQMPAVVVSTFICDDPRLDPRVPCVDETFHRNVCDRFEKLPVGDAVGIQCVTYGRGACHSSIVVLREKGYVEISFPAADRAANDKTTERKACADAVVVARTVSPFKEVLASFRFRRAE